MTVELHTRQGNCIVSMRGEYDPIRLEVVQGAIDCALDNHPPHLVLDCQRVEALPENFANVISEYLIQREVTAKVVFRLPPGQTSKGVVRNLPRSGQTQPLRVG